MPRPFDAQLRSELPADGFTTNALVTITLAISYDRFPIHSSYKIKYRDNFIRAFVALPGRHMAGSIPNDVTWGREKKLE